MGGVISLDESQPMYFMFLVTSYQNMVAAMVFSRLTDVVTRQDRFWPRFSPLGEVLRITIDTRRQTAKRNLITATLVIIGNGYNDTFDQKPIC